MQASECRVRLCDISTTRASCGPWTYRHVRISAWPRDSMRWLWKTCVWPCECQELHAIDSFFSAGSSSSSSLLAEHDTERQLDVRTMCSRGPTTTLNICIQSGSPTWLKQQVHASCAHNHNTCSQCHAQCITSKSRQTRTVRQHSMQRRGKGVRGSPTSCLSLRPTRTSTANLLKPQKES
jgi:hypothetical protein